MGKLIINYNTLSLGMPLTESLKCKSNERAEEIVAGRRNVKSWKWYDKFDYIPRPQKKKKKSDKMSLEEMEQMIKKL